MGEQRASGTDKRCENPVQRAITHTGRGSRCYTRKRRRYPQRRRINMERKPERPALPESRRRFLKQAVTVAGAAAAAIGCSEDFFRKHYKELTHEDNKRIFQSIETEVKARSGVTVHISDPPPLTGVEFAY